MHERDRHYGKWLSAAAVVAVIAGTAYIAGSYRPHAAPAAQAQAPIAAASAATPEAPPPETAKVAATPAAAVETPSSFAERLAASEAWLKSRPDTHYFIQLLTTDGNNQRGVETFLAHNTKALDAQQVRVYRSRLSGRERLGVIYGDYPSIEVASAELQKVARITPTSSPYIRTFSKLR